ncbi:MAG TPA: hypothetical protein VHO46_00540 [Bacteroidales bacterium]|nr:hypothetical protein [Bacteroidales bacterium]
MKTMSKSGFRVAAIFFLLISFPFLSSNAAELEKTFSWKNSVAPGTRVVIENYDCDLIIHVWDKQEAEFHLTVEATGKTSDDEARLVKYLENYQFNNSGASVSFKNTFWENRQTNNNKTTLEIEGGKDIELTEFSMKAELWIPSSNPFEMNSKYSEVSMEEFKAALTLDLYNSNLSGHNLTGNAKITAKYAGLEFGDIKDLNFDMYNSTFEAGNTGNITGLAKYSRFNAVNSAKVDINSYNDKFAFEKTGDIIFRSKYSDFKTILSGDADIECYNGILNFGETKDVTIDSKYADFEFNKTGKCDITNSYNDKIRFGEISSLNVVVSKYSIYKAGKITSSLIESDGYNDRFSIQSFGEDLKKISINGKYLDITIGLLSSTDFRLRAEIKYPSFEPDEKFIRTKTKVIDNSDLQYEGVKGTEKEGMPEIDIKGYNVAFRINEVN